MYDVRDITNFVLDSAERRKVAITNLSLQKLLYFINGWFFSIYEKPLIKSKFEAWQYGPVQRVIYDQFKSCKSDSIVELRATFLDPETGKSYYRKPDLCDEHVLLIEQVLDQYVHLSAGSLVNESHVEDGPWEYVWNQAEDVVYPGMKIPNAIILDHFKRLKPIITLH